jgi:hypothetical protein
MMSPRGECSIEVKDLPTVVHAKSGNTAAKKKAAENTVIKIIQKEWEKEIDRLDTKKNG